MGCRLSGKGPGISSGSCDAKQMENASFVSVAHSCPPLTAGRGVAPGSAVSNAVLSALFSEALERSSRPDNTGQWLMHTEFPFGSGTCVHTEEPVPRTPPAPLQRKHVLLRRAPLWLGPAAGISGRRSAGGDNAWCVCDLSRAYTALPQTRPHLSPGKQAGRAGVHVTQVTVSAAAPDVPATCHTLRRRFACARSRNLTTVQKGYVASLCWTPELRFRRS